MGDIRYNSIILYINPHQLIHYFEKNKKYIKLYKPRAFCFPYLKLKLINILNLLFFYILWCSKDTKNHLQCSLCEKKLVTQSTIFLVFWMERTQMEFWEKMFSCSSFEGPFNLEKRTVKSKYFILLYLKWWLTM